MTKKKRGHPDLEEVLARPWCYYCERDFDDLKILINHQKAKHFKCERCGRRLNTAGGLNVHMSQVHKEALSAVDNALGNRAGLDIEIFGMEGIPEDIMQQHNQRVIAQYHQNLAEKHGTAAAGGNPGSTSAGSGPSKKPKFESPSDLKKRLAEHKARLAEQQANGGSGSTTPVGAGQTQSPGGFNSSQYPQQQQYSPANGPAVYPLPQSTFAGTTGTQQFPPQQAPYNGGAGPFGFSQAPSQPGAHTNNAFPQPSFSPPPSTFSGQPPNGQAYPVSQYPPPGISGMPSFQKGPPNGPPTPYGAPSPPVPFQPGQQPARVHTPPQSVQQASKPGGLPPIPGLPQRPAVGAPHVNAYQMQQMHQGQLPGQSNSSIPQSLPGNEPSSLDELISGASRQADEAARAQLAQAAVAPTPAVAGVNLATSDAATAAFEAISAAKKAGEEQGEEKSGKKEKEKSKASRLVYSDNDVSPEEKMAMLPRYAYQKVGA